MHQLLAAGDLEASSATRWASTVSIANGPLEKGFICSNKVLLAL